LPRAFETAFPGYFPSLVMHSSGTSRRSGITMPSKSRRPPSPWPSCCICSSWLRHHGTWSACRTTVGLSKKLCHAQGLVYALGPRRYGGRCLAHRENLDLLHPNADSIMVTWTLLSEISEPPRWWDHPAVYGRDSIQWFAGKVPAMSAYCDSRRPPCAPRLTSA